MAILSFGTLNVINWNRNKIGRHSGLRTGLRCWLRHPHKLNIPLLSSPIVSHMLSFWGDAIGTAGLNLNAADKRAFRILSPTFQQRNAGKFMKYKSQKYCLAIKNK